MAIFNKNEKEEQVRETPQNKISMIAAGMQIEGTLESKGDIRVEGKIKGTLICKAKLVIGNSGVVDGNLDAKQATIAGHVEGSVIVRDVLQIQETARINGDVICERMNMQTGGVITGQIKMGAEAREIISKQPSQDKKANGAVVKPEAEVKESQTPAEPAKA